MKAAEYNRKYTERLDVRRFANINNDAGEVISTLNSNCEEQIKIHGA